MDRQGVIPVERIKKVLMIIAPKNFRDEEYLEPRDAFNRNNLEVKVASTTKEIATGSISARIMPDITVKEANPSDYDAVVFVGGAGCAIYIGDKEANRIITEANKADKLICAICKAPTILAEAGVLKGRKATVWNSPENLEILKRNGAVYTGNMVEEDGNIITANGPTAALLFAKHIVERLEKM